MTITLTRGFGRGVAAGYRVAIFRNQIADKPIELALLLEFAGRRCTSEQLIVAVVRKKQNILSASASGAIGGGARVSSIG